MRGKDDDMIPQNYMMRPGTEGSGENCYFCESTDWAESGRFPVVYEGRTRGLPSYTGGENGELRLAHLHHSASHDDVKDDELFPVRSQEGFLRTAPGNAGPERAAD